MNAISIDDRDLCDDGGPGDGLCLNIGRRLCLIKLGMIKLGMIKLHGLGIKGFRSATCYNVNFAACRCSDDCGEDSFHERRGYEPDLAGRLRQNL